MAAEPFVVERALRNETATQQFRQLNPPRKRRAESITDYSDKAFQWKVNGQYTDDRAKKRQREATHTEAKDRIDKLRGGVEQTVNNGAVTCWLRNMVCNCLGSRPGWKGGELSEEEDSATNLNLGYTREENSEYEDEDDGGQLIARKVAARLHEQPAPCKSKFVRIEATPGSQRATILASRILKAGKGGSGLPNWVHPKWTKIFLPTLAYAQFISNQPFEAFKPSSPVFVATVQQIFGLVYSHNITEVDVLVKEAAQRLATKRSKIVAAVMREVKNFFEQDTYVNHPTQVEGYVRWALQPDGPAYHEAPTPITCKFERSHQEYIHPKGTFQSPFINRVAKHFLLQAEGSALEPPISASNPPKGLYGLLLVSVERAFTAFSSGDYKKPKAKFSHENYSAQLETYMGHLDIVQPELWKEILYRANTSNVHDAPQDNASTMSINRQNLYIPGNPGNEA